MPFVKRAPSWAFSARFLHHLNQFGLQSLLKFGLKRSRVRFSFLLKTFGLRFPRIHTPLRSRKPPADVIVSLTTFPERATTVWATIETILRQTVAAREVVLVLAEDEFPGRRIPRGLERRGRDQITILWIEKSIRSFAKLLPARAAFPDTAIITVDDDVLYERDMIDRLVRASLSREDHIVGHRGWNPSVKAGGIEPYGEWMKAGSANPSSDEQLVFLTGVGGVLYPPRRPPDEVLLDIDTALEVAPTADDVWFWAAAVSTGVPRFCTGESFGRPNGLEALSRNLYATNQHANDRQIAAAIEALRLAERLTTRAAKG